MSRADPNFPYAEVDDLVKDAGFKPSTPIEEGIKRFVKWDRGYYKQ